jgi:hypothetical protein
MQADPVFGPYGQEQDSDPKDSQQEHSRRAGADPEGSHRFRRRPEGHGENRGREEGSDEGLRTPREENGSPKGSADEDLPAGGEESTEQEGGPGKASVQKKATPAATKKSAAKRR